MIKIWKRTHNIK